MFATRALLIAVSLTGAVVLAPAAAAQEAPRTDRLEGIASRLDAEGSDVQQLRRELEDVLRAEPATALEVPALLRSGVVTDGTAALLIGKLEVVGSPEAQDGLRRIADDPALSAMNRTRALIALGGLSHPDQASVDALWSAHKVRGDAADRDRSNTAALSLGIVARTLDEDEPARAASVRAQLVDALHTSSDPVGSAMLLRALGNTGAPALLDEAAPYLFDPAPLVRSAAAKAVGRLPRAGSAELLALCLADEPVSMVRVSLAQSLLRLGEADEFALRLVDQRVSSESHDVARLAMAGYLADHLDVYPGSRPTLVDLRDHDPSRSVRVLLLEKIGI